MKKLTQKNSLVGMARNCGERNLFYNLFTLFAFLVITGVAQKSHAQVKFDVDFYNESSTTMTINVYDGSLSLLTSFTGAGSNTLTSSGCIPLSPGQTVYQIDVVSPAPCSRTVSFYATSTTSGVITFSSVSSVCSFYGYNSMTCAGAGGSTGCSGSNNFHYLV